MPSEAEVRPFRVDLPDEAIADLRRRITAMRWPTKELVGDRSQGVQLATIQELARYWAADYDWRACEAKLNALPQAAALADRAAAHAAPDNPWAVATLLDSLREAGADEQAAALAARLPAAGMFGLFLKQQGPADHFRFGREADGAPAAPWGWEDLDLWLVPRARGRRHRNRRDDLNNRRPNRSDQLFEALVTDAANANFTWAGQYCPIRAKVTRSRVRLQVILRRHRSREDVAAKQPLLLGRPQAGGLLVEIADLDRFGSECVE